MSGLSRVSIISAMAIGLGAVAQLYSQHQHRRYLELTGKYPVREENYIGFTGTMGDAALIVNANTP